jgi:hypothetical protein
MGLKSLSTPRTITPDQHARIVLCLKEGPKGVVALKPGFLDRDAQPLADEIGKILDEADGFPRADEKSDILKWQTPGIVLVIQDLKHAPAQAVTIQKCFTAVGIEMFGYPDPKYAPDAVTIGIGPRT